MPTVRLIRRWGPHQIGDLPDVDQHTADWLMSIGYAVRVKQPVPAPEQAPAPTPTQETFPDAMATAVRDLQPEPEADAPKVRRPTRRRTTDSS